MDAFPLCDFLCSPFRHVIFIHASLQEKFARFHYRITHALLGALADTGPERGRLLGTAVRWYTGMPQILLRKRSDIGPRLQLFLAGKYDILINDLARDAEKEAAKRRPSKPDTPQQRLNQCLGLFEKGHLRRGLRMLEGLGRASSKRRHPRTDGRQTPGRRQTLPTAEV